jgi:hypothetical protein
MHAAAAAHEGVDDAVDEHERVEQRAVRILQAPAVCMGNMTCVSQRHP